MTDQDSTATPQVFDIGSFQEFCTEHALVIVVSNKTQLPVVVWNFEPGQANDAHTHARTEHVHIVIEGELEYRLDNQPGCMVHTGQAVLIPAGVTHEVRNRTSGRSSYVAISSPGPYERLPATSSSQ
jgi:quercetin dioxygenase-like cupin family protein